MESQFVRNYDDYSNMILNVLANLKKIAILLISFTVVVAQTDDTGIALLDKIVKDRENGTTTATPCDKCLEVVHDDCEWNEEVIPGSKTDFHHGVCPCPGDGTKDKCKVVQRRITGRNIQALQAWSASSLLMSICIAGKIYRIIPYNFYD